MSSPHPHTYKAGAGVFFGGWQSQSKLTMSLGAAGAATSWPRRSSRFSKPTERLVSSCDTAVPSKRLKRQQPDLGNTVPPPLPQPPPFQKPSQKVERIAQIKEKVVARVNTTQRTSQDVFGAHLPAPTGRSSSYAAPPRPILPLVSPSATITITTEACTSSEAEIESPTERPKSLVAPRFLIPQPIDFRRIVDDSLACIMHHPSDGQRRDLIVGMIRATKITYETMCLEYEWRLAECAAALHSERAAALAFMTMQLKQYGVNI